MKEACVKIRNPIKILTTNIKDMPKGTISQALKDLKTEGFNIELRIYTASILHDRYIIDDSIKPSPMYPHSISSLK